MNLRVKKNSASAPSASSNSARVNIKVKKKASSPTSTNIRKASKPKQGDERKHAKKEKEKAVFIDDSSSSSSRSRTDSQGSRFSYASDDTDISSAQLREKNVDTTIASAVSNASLSLPPQIDYSPSTSVTKHLSTGVYTDNNDEDGQSNNNNNLSKNSIVTNDSFPLPTFPDLRSSSQNCSNGSNETIRTQFHNSSTFTEDDFLAHLEKIFDKLGGDRPSSSTSDDDLLSILSLDQETSLSFL